MSKFTALALSLALSFVGFAAHAADADASTAKAISAHVAPTSDDIATHTAANDVWVNTKSNVYHDAGSHWYGLTKDGAFMPLAQAVARGARHSGTRYLPPVTVTAVTK